MMRNIDFGDHAHRCLFWNDCVQAHLLGLKPDCRCFEACFPQDSTVIVTFGEVRAQIGGRHQDLRAGDQLEIPHASPLRLFTSSEADVMLLLKPKALAA